MHRALLICVGLSCTPSIGFAQGVPTQDNSGIGRLVTILGSLGEDMSIQRETASTQDQLAEVQAEQLRLLEEMTATMTGSGFDVASLETGGSFPASSIYPAFSNHPMDARLFGEGRETI
ncbi:MAG: lytic transglycosylase domain-containing protein, partial [Donghicola eburneus]|nr:lytic transglycosylase domain-containing protein [Donghicola eburneus]